MGRMRHDRYESITYVSVQVNKAVSLITRYCSKRPILFNENRNPMIIHQTLRKT